jgi:hypothetical protein
VLFGTMGMDWRLRVCWLLVLHQVFVGLMYFGGEEKPPYGGAEGIRMEDEDAMDVDSEGELTEMNPLLQFYCRSRQTIKFTSVSSKNKNDSEQNS